MTDLEWFASNPKELDGFKDKYVAIYENQVIGSGDTVKEALAQAKIAKPDSDPLVAYVESGVIQALNGFLQARFGAKPK